jgi:hypothetical protein
LPTYPCLKCARVEEERKKREKEEQKKESKKKVEDKAENEEESAIGNSCNHLCGDCQNARDLKSYWFHHLPPVPDHQRMRQVFFHDNDEDAMKHWYALLLLAGHVP